MAQYTCPIEGCNASFDKEEDFMKHGVEAHGMKHEVKHACCSINFYTEEGHKEHQEKVHGKKEAM